jgi:hypothetical protein
MAYSFENRCKTFEGIEKTIRGQLLDYVNPEIALFLSKQKQESTKVEKGK